jgi:hypothetical protein
MLGVKTILAIYMTEAIVVLMVGIVALAYPLF